MPPDMWPKSLDEFYAYWDEKIANLNVTPEAVQLSRDLMYPRNISFWLRPMGPTARVLTINWLPERLRRTYGFTNGRVRRGAYKAVVGYTKVVHPLVPRGLKTLPSRLYIKDMRKVVKRLEETGSWEKK